jgi:peptide/nickel transport system substrate-binding protein
VDNFRSTREQQVGETRTPWGRADSRLAHAAPSCGSPHARLLPLALSLGIVGALFAVACTGAAPPASPRGPLTLTIGFPQSRQVDPSHGASTLADQIAFERLTINDAEGRTQPRLLRGWTVSQDGLTWRLVVRPGVRFHDGSPLTASDVKRTLDAAIASPSRRALSVCLGYITNVVARGDGEVLVSLRQRCSYLLDDLDRPVTRLAPDGKTSLGTGPFSIVSSSADEIALQANRNYYLGPPVIDRVVVRPYDALRTAWAEMMRGRVDFLWEVGPDTAEFLRDQSTIEVRSFLSYYAYAVMLNSARPTFKEPAVRRALNLAIDRATLVQQGLKGRGVPADGPVWPRYWARNRGAPAIPYNPGAAAALLQAGHAGPIEFTCLVPANFSILERLALLVQRQLSDVDVRVRLESLPPDAFTRRIISGDFDAVLLPLLGGPQAAVYHRFWHSPTDSLRWNFWGYRNAVVDAALDTALEAPDERHFSDAIQRFEAAVRDDPPAIFLAWNQTVQAVSRRFSVPAENDGRDAIHVLGRWLLRQPGGGAP